MSLNYQNIANNIEIALQEYSTITNYHETNIASKFNFSVKYSFE
jgi:hypothetical protein